MEIRNARERKRRKQWREAHVHLYEENALALAILSQQHDEELKSDDETDNVDYVWRDKLARINCPSSSKSYAESLLSPEVHEKEQCHNTELETNNTCSNPCNSGPMQEVLEASRQYEDVDEAVHISVDRSDCGMCVAESCVNIIDSVDHSQNVIEEDNETSSDDMCINESSGDISDFEIKEPFPQCRENEETVQDPLTFGQFHLSSVSVSPEVWSIISGEKEKNTPEEELKLELTLWAKKYKLQRNALDELLHTLRGHGHCHLPACAKTLLKTPRSTVDIVKKCSGGQFWYRGIKNGLMTCLDKEYVQSLQDQTVEIDVFIDGVCPYKSVKVNLWPIAGCLKGKKTPFIIALWCGCTKEPSSVHEFFEDYVAEAAYLKENGIVCHGTKLKLVIRRYIADAPARAWMRAVRAHNSYNACERCTAPGEWKFRRITYNPAHEGELRTDESFESQSHKDHHIGISPLLCLGTQMISQFPLDVMHLVYLGVSRRLYSLLLTRKAGKYKLHNNEISSLDKLCIFLSPFCPSDFARKPRPLSQYLLFKATEWRRLLLYDGFILHRNHKHKEVHECYLLLATAMRILLDPRLRSEYSSDAHELLFKFVKHSYRFLGASFVVYNVHHLIHLTAECTIHGDPEDFSCFKFENHLGQMKHLLVAPGRTLQQIVCRVIEHSLIPKTVSTAAQFEELSMPHNRGPTLNYHGKQYAAMKIAGSVIRVAGVTPKDSFVLMSSGQIVVVENIIRVSSVLIIGRQFLEKSDFFQFPVPSSALNIFLVSRLGVLEKWRKEDIVQKVVYFPLAVEENYSDGYDWKEGEGLCIPLLHSEVYV